VVATKESLAFYDPADIIKAGARVWTDEDEWSVNTGAFQKSLAVSTSMTGVIQDWRSDPAYRVEEVG
jgi:hypothetical protein